MILGTILTGLSTGIASFIVPLYSKIYIVRELAPIEIYARLGAINQFMITLGIFISYVIGEVGEVSGNEWIIFIFPMFASFTQILLFKFKYKKDTPTFLMMKNKKKEATALVNELYFNKREDDDEDGTEDGLLASQISNNYKSVHYRDLFKSVNLTESLKMGCIISILQQFSGVNVIIMSSTEFLTAKGPMNKKIITILVGFVNWVFGSLSVIILHKHYRKHLQLGALGMCACYIIAIIAVGTSSSSSFEAIYVACILLFIISFEISIGPIMWVYCADILSDKGVAVTSAINWVSALIVVGIFTTFGYEDTFKYKENQDKETQDRENIPFIFMNFIFLVSCCIVSDIQIFYYSRYKMRERNEILEVN